MSVHSKKAFLLPAPWAGLEYTWALIKKKNQLICFEIYPGYGISYSQPQVEQTEESEHFANG